MNKIVDSINKLFLFYAVHKSRLFLGSDLHNFSRLAFSAAGLVLPPSYSSA